MTGTPVNVLERVLPQLRGAGIVRSGRGRAVATGSTTPPRTSPWETVVRIISGPLAPISSATRHEPEPCSMEVCCSLRETWKQVRDATIAILNVATFADLAARAGGRWHDPMSVALPTRRGSSST